MNASVLTHCPNCAQPLVPADARFCAHCGQENHLRPPTLMEFGQQFAGAYISTEGALWRSLRLLLTKPGELTLEYWRGRRKHYVLPLRLYLTISVMALVLLRLTNTSHVDQVLETHFTQALRDGEMFNVISMGPLGEITLQKGQYSCTHLPELVCERVRQRLSGDPAKAMHWLVGAIVGLYDHINQAMFVLLPLFAVWTKLAYWRRRRYYTEHLVLALHLHSFLFLAIAVGSIPWAPLKLVAPAAVVVYPLLALQRVFNGPIWATVLRCAAIVALHLLAIALVVYLIFLGTLAG